jgi:bifunctional non-homologous end joining protein LigD
MARVDVQPTRPKSRFAEIPGARRAPFPGFIAPCHPTDRDEVPPGDEWLHEVKYDGYRSQVHVKQGKVTIYTRNGFDWTHRYRGIAETVAALRIGEAIFDGEITVPDTRGISDFAA